ncbi:hypothetical protein EON65_21910 [archaeon]|nr:MAG: hypothetical protein EON65_21910 [archaeon]
MMVAQEAEEDWPLEVYDRQGRAHNVTMQPGDVLLYESHSLLHGRPFSLRGNYYVRSHAFIDCRETVTTINCSPYV